jgi:hypothetical protein
VTINWTQHLPNWPKGIICTSSLVRLIVKENLWQASEISGYIKVLELTRTLIRVGGCNHTKYNFLLCHEISKNKYVFYFAIILSSPRFTVCCSFSHPCIVIIMRLM